MNSLHNHLTPISAITIFQCVRCGDRLAVPSDAKIPVGEINCMNCITSPRQLRLVGRNPITLSFGGDHARTDAAQL